MRLGDLEQRILLVLITALGKSDPPMPDDWCAEPPGMLCGWTIWSSHGHPDVSGLRMFRRASIEAYRQPSPARWRASTTRV